MSTTYLLAAKSTKRQRRPAGPTTSATSSDTDVSSHSDAVWVTKTSLLPSGIPLVLTASADYTVKSWDYKTLTPLATYKSSPSLGIVGLDIDPSPSGAKYFISNSIDSVLSRYSLSDNQPGKRKELGPGQSWRVAIHPRSDRFATAGVEVEVKIMSTEVDNFGEETGGVSGTGTGTFGLELVYSPDGKFLAVATETGHVLLYDATTMQLVSTFPAHSAPIRSLVFSSSLLITASDDKRINVFDLRALSVGLGSGSAGGRKGQVSSLGGHEGWVCSLGVRNDRLLASGSSDGTIKLWDLASLGSSAISTLRDDGTMGDVWSLSWLPESGATVGVEGMQGTGAGLGGGKLISGAEDGLVRSWRGGG